MVVQLGETVVKRETAVGYSQREQETTGYVLMLGHCSRPTSTFVRMKPLDILDDGALFRIIFTFVSVETMDIYIFFLHGTTVGDHVSTFVSMKLLVIFKPSGHFPTVFVATNTDIFTEVSGHFSAMLSATEPGEPKPDLFLTHSPE